MNPQNDNWPLLCTDDQSCEMIEEKIKSLKEMDLKRILELIDQPKPCLAAAFQDFERKPKSVVKNDGNPTKTKHTGACREPGFDDCRGAAGAGGEGQREGGRRGRIKLVCRVAKQNKSRS